MKKLRLPAVTAESAFFYFTLAIAGWYLSWTLMFMILLEDRMSIMSLLLFLLPLLPTAIAFVKFCKLKSQVFQLVSPVDELLDRVTHSRLPDSDELDDPFSSGRRL